MSCIRWNKNVILMKFSSLAALEVVKMTTSSAASNENFIKMMTFPSQCIMYRRHWLRQNISFTICSSYIVHGTDDLTMACVPYAHYWYYCIVIYVYFRHVSYVYTCYCIVLRMNYFAMLCKWVKHVTVKIQFTVQVITIHLYIGCQHHRVSRGQLRLRHGWKNTYIVSCGKQLPIHALRSNIVNSAAVESRHTWIITYHYFVMQ